MSNSTVFVGIDYATAFVQVCVMDGRGQQLANRRCANSWKAIADCVTPHGRDIRAAIEACNGSSDLAEELLQEAKWSIDLAHPGYVARMKQSPDKSDYTDARMLADLVRVGYLPRVWLAPTYIRELRRLVRHRFNLVKRRKSLKLRIGGLLRDHRLFPPAKVGRWTLAWWSWLSSLELPSESRWILDETVDELKSVTCRISAAEDRITAYVSGDRFVAGMLTMRAIGMITATAIRAEVGDVTRFRTGKQLARFCGLSPRNASSGTRRKLTPVWSRPAIATFGRYSWKLRIA